MEQRTKYVALTIIVLITLCAALLFSRSSKAKAEVKPIYWGGTFGGKTPLSNNVKYDCSHNGQPTCCALLDDDISSQPSRSLQNSTTSRSLLKGTKSLKALKPFEKLHEKQYEKQHDKHEMCTTKKLYIPSPYESAHFAKAEELHGIKDEKNRTRALIAYIQEEIPASIAWLARVKEHMSSEAVPLATEDDLQYLSRFQITRTCKGQSKTWVEWIEPLTVHARHPFGFDQCSDISVYTREQMLHFGFVDMVSLDYMIVQSGQSLHEATSVTSHNHTKPLRVGNKAGHKGEHVTSSFLFDAGTSTFDSSLVWFLCAYLQVRTMLTLFCTRLSFELLSTVSYSPIFNSIYKHYIEHTPYYTAQDRLRPELRLRIHPFGAGRLLETCSSARDPHLPLLQRSRACQHHRPSVPAEDHPRHRHGG